MPQLSPMSWTFLFLLMISMIKMMQFSKPMVKINNNKKVKMMKNKWSW